uniref:Secreted protein n=1 Tax=Syphacia muris TaxID=451379 RepID=A0A0N5B1M8_9BILA
LQFWKCVLSLLGFITSKYACVARGGHEAKRVKPGASKVVQNIGFKLCDRQKRCDKSQLLMPRLEELCECKRLKWPKLMITVKRAERALIHAIMYKD